MNQKRRVQHQWCLALACLLTPYGVVASNQQDLETEFLRSAQIWDAKNRPDMARQLVNKLLATNPDSPQGLVYLGELALKENKPIEANKVLEKLRALPLQQSAVRDMEILIRVYGSDREKLTRFQVMARIGGKAADADLARELFPQGPPSVGALAMDYYQIMMASPQDADEAGKQLTRLYIKTGNSLYQLAKLRMQLRLDVSAKTILGEIEKLSNQSNDNQQSLQSLWKRLLDQLNYPGSNSSAWIKTYLKRFPGDLAMAERLAAMRLEDERADRIARDPITLARNAANKALGKGQLDVAESRLEAVLSERPRDADSLGKLGLVRLRQGRHLEAEDLFSRAYQLDPQTEWKNLQSTSQFWGLVGLARAAVERADLGAASDLAEQANHIRPENVEALVTLADIKLVMNEVELAQSLYLHALKNEPNNTLALRGLVGIYVKREQYDQALDLLTQTIASDPAQGDKLSGTQADILKTQAEVLIEANRLSPALRTMETAVLIAPEDPWIRYRLARLYQRLELPGEAFSVMNDGVKRLPNDLEMRHARALIRSALDDDAGALEDIRQIPETQRSDSIRELEQRTSVRLQVAEAEHPDKRAQAGAILIRAENMAGNDPDLLLSVANTWFRLNEPSRGVAVFDRLLARQPVLSPDGELQYALLLNRAKNDPALTQRLPKLLSMRGWTPQQELRLLDLYTDHQERQIEQQRLAGNTDVATSMAQVILPGNAAIDINQRRKAQARLLMAAGAYAEVADLIGPTSQYQPADIDFHFDLGNGLARQGLLRAAADQARWLDLQIKEDDLPRRLALLRLWQRSQSLEAARKESLNLLQRFPDNLEVIQSAARMERDSGQYGQAILLFRRARLAAESSPAVALGKVNASNTATPVGNEDGLREPLLHFAYGISTRPMATATTNRPNRTTPITDAPLALTLTAISESATATNPVNQIQRDIDSIESRRQAWIEVGQKRLQKSSTSGISTLNGWERPVVVSLPWRLDGRYFAHMDQVNLDAGQLPSVNTDESGFGQIAPNIPSSFPADSAMQSARGLNLGVGYEGDGLNWDVGAVGVGFPVTNMVGGVSQRLEGDGYSFTLELSRRPLTGSLLSYAGTQDPVTRQVWGGVVATGVSGRIATDIGSYSVSASANVAQLRGRNVEDNSRFQLRLSMDRDLYVKPGRLLNVGLALAAWHYEKDLSEFTWGNGGYYSPQRYFSLSLPVEWSGRDGPMTWQLRGAVSASRSSSDESAYFPTNPLLQAQAQASLTGGQAPFYAGSASSGSGFSLRGALEYQVTPQTALGAQLEVDRSAYYSPNNLLLYARYQFGPGAAPLANRPRPLQAYSSF